MNMNAIDKLVLNDHEDELESAYDNLNALSEETLYDLLDGLVATSEEFIHMDDVEFHTIDRDESDSKEIVSGDAHLRVVEDDDFGETTNEYEIQYEVNRGHDGANDSEPIYDPVEVVIRFKN